MAELLRVLGQGWSTSPTHSRISGLETALALGEGDLAAELVPVETRGSGDAFDRNHAYHGWEGRVCEGGMCHTAAIC